jgi:hypothetical protein
MVPEDLEEEKEEDIYSEGGREELVEDDEIEPWEQGFMQGAEGGGQGAKCRKCGKPLVDDVVEKEIDGENYRFCSEECAKKFEK